MLSFNQFVGSETGITLVFAEAFSAKYWRAGIGLACDGASRPIPPPGTRLVAYAPRKVKAERVPMRFWYFSCLAHPDVFLDGFDNPGESSNVVLPSSIKPNDPFMAAVPRDTVWGRLPSPLEAIHMKFWHWQLNTYSPSHEKLTRVVTHWDQESICV